MDPAEPAWLTHSRQVEELAGAILLVSELCEREAPNTSDAIAGAATDLSPLVEATYPIDESLTAKFPELGDITDTIALPGRREDFVSAHEAAIIEGAYFVEAIKAARTRPEIAAEVQSMAESVEGLDVRAEIKHRRESEWTSLRSKILEDWGSDWRAAFRGVPARIVRERQACRDFDPPQRKPRKKAGRRQKDPSAVADWNLAVTEFRASDRFKPRVSALKEFIDEAEGDKYPTIDGKSEHELKAVARRKGAQKLSGS